MEDIGNLGIKTLHPLIAAGAAGQAFGGVPTAGFF
jgi:hypothetical protein